MTFTLGTADVDIAIAALILILGTCFVDRYRRYPDAADMIRAIGRDKMPRRYQAGRACDALFVGAIVAFIVDYVLSSTVTDPHRPGIYLLVAVLVCLVAFSFFAVDEARKDVDVAGSWASEMNRISSKPPDQLHNDYERQYQLAEQEASFFLAVKLKYVHESSEECTIPRVRGEIDYERVHRAFIDAKARAHASLPHIYLKAKTSVVEQGNLIGSYVVVTSAWIAVIVYVWLRSHGIV